MSLQVGAKVNRFVVRERIGQGGMGEVFRAWDPLLLRDVAIKRAGDPRLAAASRNIRHEGRLASTVRHPAIVRIYDLVEHEGCLLIVQEYVEGETLRSRLARTGETGNTATDAVPARAAIDLPSFFKIFKTCLDAVADIASENLVHGDLKPENIMVDRSGRARILDFGLARSVGPATAGPADVPGGEDLSSTLDLVFSIRGTPGYIAPEILTGEEPNVQSDLFSLGVIAYELLSGRNPFFRKTVPAMLAATLYDRPEPLSRQAPDIPLELNDLVMAMIEKDRGPFGHRAPVPRSALLRGPPRSGRILGRDLDLAACAGSYAPGPASAAGGGGVSLPGRRAGPVGGGGAHDRRGA
jgi:serine/threonine protein kinase